MKEVFYIAKISTDADDDAPYFFILSTKYDTYEDAMNEISLFAEGTYQIQKYFEINKK